jgi:hypothetical protein
VRPETVEDRRTPPEQRQAERSAIEERLWAGVMVLSEVVASVLELVRDREDEWLADLRGQVSELEEREAAV